MSILPLTINLHSLFNGTHAHDTLGLQTFFDQKIAQALSQQPAGVNWHLHKTMRIHLRSHEAYVQIWLQTDAEPAFTASCHSVGMLGSIIATWSNTFFPFAALGASWSFPSPTTAWWDVNLSDATPHFIGNFNYTVCIMSAVLPTAGQGNTFSPFATQGNQPAPIEQVPANPSALLDEPWDDEDNPVEEGSSEEEFVDIDPADAVSAGYIEATSPVELSVLIDMVREKLHDDNDVSIPHLGQLAHDSNRMMAYLRQHSTEDLSFLHHSIGLKPNLIERLSEELGHKTQPLLFPGGFPELRKGMWDSWGGGRRMSRFVPEDPGPHSQEYMKLLYKFLCATGSIYPIGDPKDPSGLLLWKIKDLERRWAGEDGALFPGHTPFAAMDPMQVFNEFNRYIQQENLNVRTTNSFARHDALNLIARMWVQIEELSNQVPTIIEFHNPHHWS